MARLTVIFGPQCSGKSSTASALTRAKKTLFLNPCNLRSPFCFSPLYDQEVDYVVIDELPLERLDEVLTIANAPKLLVEKQLEKAKSIDTPKFFVVISNEPTPEQVLAIAGGRNFEIIECRRKEVSNG